MPAKSLNDADQDFYLTKSSSDPNEREANIEFIFGNEHTSIAEITIWYSEKCDAWVIDESHAVKGWGPFIYDIAMEWATLKGDGLTCDRESVSDQARSVWKHYFDKRQDVVKIDADWLRDIGYLYFDDICLSKIYTKAPTTIGALKSANRWREN